MVRVLSCETLTQAGTRNSPDAQPDSPLAGLVGKSGSGAAGPRCRRILLFPADFQGLELSVMILFLDFDGVLHPSPAAGEVFCCVHRVWTILRARPFLEVVFSTSWREAYDPEAMLNFSTANGGEDLLDRFVGSNPILSNEPAYQREAECLAWLHGNGMHDRPWLALDDDPLQFNDEHRLYLVDRRTGLTLADVPRILARI